MSARIDTLIDKEDNFTLIRNEIAAILAVEVASQKVLATAASKDPALMFIRKEVIRGLLKKIMTVR